jgi:SAM-dependent methyltransferase
MEDSQATKEFYEKGNEQFLCLPYNTYDLGHSRLATSAPNKYVESLLPVPPSGKSLRFLDLWCGTGIWSIGPAKLGYEVWGVDFSPKAVEVARWLAATNQVADRCHFVVSDALEYLRSTELTFDVVFISGSLHYLDLEQFLPCLTRCLRPGGQFFCIGTNGSNVTMNAVRRFLNVVKHHRDPRSLDRLIRLRTYPKIAACFEESEIRFFDCVTLLSGVFRGHGRFSISFHAFARRVDHVLLNVLGLHFLSFKVVFHGRVHGVPFTPGAPHSKRSRGSPGDAQKLLFFGSLLGREEG